MKFKIRLIDGTNIVRVDCPGYETQRFVVQVHAGRITLQNVCRRGGSSRGLTASRPTTEASKKPVESPAPEPVRPSPIQLNLQGGGDVYMDMTMRQPYEGQKFGSQDLGGDGDVDRLFKLDVWQPIPASRKVVKNTAAKPKTLSSKMRSGEFSMPTASLSPHEKRRKTGLLSETTVLKPTQKDDIPPLRVDQTIILGKRDADRLSAKPFNRMKIRPNLVKAETKQRSQDLMTNPSQDDLGEHQVTTSSKQLHSASLKSLERKQRKLAKEKIEKKMAKEKIEKEKMAKKKERKMMLRQKMEKENKERKMKLRQKMDKEKMAEMAKKMAKEKMAKIAKKMTKEKMAKQVARKKMEKEKIAKQKSAKQLRDMMKELMNGKN